MAFSMAVEKDLYLFTTGMRFAAYGVVAFILNLFLKLSGSGLLSGVPGAPTNLQAVITSTRFMTLSWEPPVNSQSPEITGILSIQKCMEQWI